MTEDVTRQNHKGTTKISQLEVMSKRYLGGPGGGGSKCESLVGGPPSYHIDESSTHTPGGIQFFPSGKQGHSPFYGKRKFFHMWHI